MADGNDTRTSENRYQGNRGQITSRPSRDSIIESYAAQDAARARNARMVSQERYRSYQENAARNQYRASQRAELDARRREEERLQAERRQMQRDLEAAQLRSDFATKGHASASDRMRGRSDRISRPLTSQESYNNTRMSMESYERERASRDVLGRSRSSRTANRDLIDARGSVDSRAFNELNELVGYSIDERDRPQPAVDVSNPKAKWVSQAGQGGEDPGLFRLPVKRRVSSHNSAFPMQGGTALGGSSRNSGLIGSILGLPLFVKIAVPVILILFIILMIILFG